MMRLSVLCTILALVVLACVGSSEARLSRNKKNRKLQNYNYGYNNNYNNNQNGQQAQGYWDENGNWVEAEQGGESQDAEQQQYNNQNGQNGNYNQYNGNNQGGNYNNNNNFDAASDAEESDTDDMFRYENLTKENYKKLLQVHDKMEAYRLATILLCVVILVLGIWIAILNCLYKREQAANMNATIVSNSDDDTVTKSRAPTTPYKKVGANGSPARPSMT